MSLLRQFLVSCALLSSASLLLHQAAALPSLPLPPGYELELRTIAKQDVQRRARESFVTQFISVQQQLVTVTDRVTVTSTQFQTCTAVAPGTPPCPTLQSAVTASPTITAAPEAVEAIQSNVTTSPSVSVLLPSCNCHEDDLPKLLDDGYRLFSRRTPRLLNPQAPQPVIVLTLTTTLVDTVLSTVQDMATTVGITYGGCIPTDAITTTACSGA